MHAMRGVLHGRTEAPGLLRDVVAWNRSGERAGIVSVCSASPFVLEAAMLQAAADDTVACLESTCNQVNQYGGYTGMTPAAFRDSLVMIAARLGLDLGCVVVGGDHLGPYPWRHEAAAAAMAKACRLVEDCVRAGYTKLHLDASMPCGGEAGVEGDPLDPRLAAARTADLCAAAEAAHAEAGPGVPAPFYVIGSEVPLPGGEPAGAGPVTPTSAAAAESALDLAREAFRERGLEAAWERVVALVVQPGVEFGDETVAVYGRSAARELVAWLKTQPPLVFEAHSTDYQPATALAEMVADHFAILKVGPGLTYAMREAFFALEDVERELGAGTAGAQLSHLQDTLDAAMVAHPEHWRDYYRGDDEQLRRARAFSYSDRCRYYWPYPEVQAALGRLFANLSAAAIPAELLARHLPRQYEALRAGRLSPRPDDLVRHAILEVLGPYAAACGMR
jgi:D-tagatose-1,6-bisphosphate aldolase subunit GatZ/KbaZ